MKALRAFAGRFALVLIFAGLVGGCVHRYPDSEGALGFTYPLQVCDHGALEAAAGQLGSPLGGLRYNQHNVCRTEAGTAQAAAATPLGTADPLADESCLPPPEPQNGLAAESDEERVRRLEAQAFTRQERCLRMHLEAPFAARVGEPARFGIALSGGGSKAAAFAVGVLAGLSDLQLLDRADYLSSVSGGSYAAYFYYAHRLFPLVRRGAQRVQASNEELFRDCVALPGPDDASAEVIRSISTRVPHCGRQSLKTFAANASVASPDGGYQTLLKCAQDLMRPGVCSTSTTRSLRKGISLPTVGGSIATVIPSFVSNSLFDWGLSTSPSAISYHDGIGLAYGATLADVSALTPELVTRRTKECGPDTVGADTVLDCTEGFFDPDPVPLSFDELRVGLLKMRNAGGMPFWIVNAAAPQHRSVYGWLRQVREDVTNSDMFEMTAVSHGSGRYGYVSASPAIHDMTVLDAVQASAAFLDANQLVLTNRVLRTSAALGLHFANLDWGIDIANYNVSTKRRLVHRSLPFPFYYLDGLIARAQDPREMTPERRDRERSVFIRLVDGGNAENLGVYSLLKRGVRNILVVDAAADGGGQFSDLCGLRRRLIHTRPGLLPRFLYFPGLQDFDKHCDRLDSNDKDVGYDLHAWFTDHPLLLGCIRQTEQTGSGAAPCQGLTGSEVRLVVAKPAIDLAAFQRQQLDPAVVATGKDENAPKSKLSACWVRGTEAPTQLLNCDTAAFLHFNHGERKGDCPIFPQHSTIRMTANSSITLFVAYRELARQYIQRDAGILQGIVGTGEPNAGAFEDALQVQARGPLAPRAPDCVRF